MIIRDDVFLNTILCTCAVGLYFFFCYILSFLCFLLEYIDIPHLLVSWCVSWTPSDSLNSVTNGPSYSFTLLPSFRLGKNYLIWVHVSLSWSSTAQLYMGTRAHRIVAAHLHISYLYSYFIFIFIFHIHIHLRLYLSLCLEV